MATKTKDLHLYLTADDQRKFETVKRIMVEMGMPASINPQAVIRFALHRTALNGKLK